MKAAIYLRQSLDATGQQLGVQRQEAECRRLCGQRGYQVAAVITDNSVSASRGVRPGYQELVQLIDRRAVDAVVVLRLDRLLRKLTDLEDLIDLSERTGVQVVTVQGDLDLSNSQGRLLGRILASVARSEVETKSERHQLANRQAAVNGRPRASRRPYGYQPDLLTVCEPEAAVLREMARQIIAGWAYKDVAAWANQAGHTTTTGKPWRSITILNMLQKDRYGGVSTYKGEPVGTGQWPPIFDPATWERLQLTIRARARLPQQNARKYLLTGFLFCGVCGKPLNGTTRQDRPGAPVRRVYHCARDRKALVPGCGRIRRNALALDHFIREAVLYRLDTPELGALLAQGRMDDAELAGLLDQRTALTARLSAFVDDYATGLLDRSQFARAKTSAEAELQRVEADIDRLNRQRFGLNLSVGQTLRQEWDANGDEWRRGLIRLLIKKITVLSGNTKPFYVADGVRYRFDPSLIEIDWLA